MAFYFKEWLIFCIFYCFLNYLIGFYILIFHLENFGFLKSKLSDVCCIHSLVLILLKNFNSSVYIVHSFITFEHFHELKGSVIKVWSEHDVISSVKFCSNTNVFFIVQKTSFNFALEGINDVELVINFWKDSKAFCAFFFRKLPWIKTWLAIHLSLKKMLNSLRYLIELNVIFSNTMMVFSKLPFKISNKSLIDFQELL